MERSVRPALVDLARLERNIEGRQPIDFAQPKHREPGLPEYVAHAEGVADVGKLTAAAAVHQYEAAAKAIEAMGGEMKKLMARCEEVIGLARDSMAEAQKAAEGYREAGKRMFIEIERYALLTQEVSEQCRTLSEKIVVSN